MCFHNCDVLSCKLPPSPVLLGAELVQTWKRQKKQRISDAPKRRRNLYFEGKISKRSKRGKILKLRIFNRKVSTILTDFYDKVVALIMIVAATAAQQR